MVSLKFYMLKSTLEGVICFLKHHEVWGKIKQLSGRAATVLSEKKFEHFPKSYKIQKDWLHYSSHGHMP